MTARPLAAVTARPLAAVTARPLSPCLLTIARSLAMSHWGGESDPKDALRLLPASTSGDPARATSANGVDIQDLRQAAATLSPLEREVIILRFVLALDYPWVTLPE